MSLRALGWDSLFEEAFAPFVQDGLIPARVAIQHRGGYEVWTASEVLSAEVSGRFRHGSPKPSDYPAVGDWAAVEPIPGETRAVIHALLPRRTRFSRKAAGLATEEQLLAANIDEVFIIESLASPPNFRRLERFLTLGWESGATPTVVLTKSDQCRNVITVVKETAAIARGSAVLAISCVANKGLGAVRRRIGKGRTVALLGPSGAGKSTLINHLVGEETQPVLPVRECDQKGRHTTTNRELVFLSGGGVLIDTPGLRELQLWEGGGGLESAFADIEAMAVGCRFTDCRHEKEPGCAVRQAVAEGRLEPTRLAGFHKLKVEIAAFAPKLRARARFDDSRHAKGVARSLRGRRVDEE